MAAVATVAMSCAPAKPEKLERPHRIPHARTADQPAPVYTRFVDRPMLSLTRPTPDFHDELRWPLSSMSHPALEPRFEIASRFAQPGIGWMELCARGVQNSTGRDKEMLAYLRGWCAAVKGDADGAVGNLVPLLGSTTSGLRVAVRTDLANILANDHADEASHLIKTYNIRDVDVLDLLSANYVEVGTRAEAAAFNRDAIASDDYASAATKCKRLTKSIVLSGDKISPLLLEVEQLATKPKLPDPTCVALHHKLDCWRDQSGCRAFYIDEGLDEALASLTDAYYSWPTGRDQRHWLGIADLALKGWQLPASHAVVLAALENARRAEGCSETLREWVSQVTVLIRAQFDESENARLDEITSACGFVGVRVPRGTSK
jgi:hypothetical protein